MGCAGTGSNPEPKSILSSIPFCLYFLEALNFEY